MNDQPILILPLAKTWSDSAREASIAARRAENRLTTIPDEIGVHVVVGSQRSSEETTKRLTETAKQHALADLEYRKRSYGKGWSKADYDETLGASYRNHGAAKAEQMRKDPQFAQDVMEAHLVGIKGVKVTGEGVDENGKAYVEFYDKLYDVTGRSQVTDNKRDEGYNVTLTSKEGKTVTAGDMKNARIKMKRVYYGGDPNKTLREQGISKWQGRVGRTAKTDGE